jgi:hypothetical protein
MSAQSCSSRELGKGTKAEPAMVEIWSAANYRADTTKSLLVSARKTLKLFNPS